MSHEKKHTGRVSSGERRAGSGGWAALRLKTCGAVNWPEGKAPTSMPQGAEQSGAPWPPPPQAGTPTTGRLSCLGVSLWVILRGYGCPFPGKRRCAGQTPGASCSRRLGWPMAVAPARAPACVPSRSLSGCFPPRRAPTLGGACGYLALFFTRCCPILWAGKAAKRDDRRMSNNTGGGRGKVVGFKNK